MTTEDKAQYEKLLEELRTIGKRLHEIGDCSWHNMEGADMPEFSIEEALVGLVEPAKSVASIVREIEGISKESGA